MKICLVGAELLHVDRQTDRHGEATKMSLLAILQSGT